MIRYYPFISNKENNQGVSCGDKIQPLGNGLVRVSFHPKGSEISVCEITDEKIVNLERSLLYLYRYCFKATFNVYEQYTVLSDLYATGLVDFGVYIDSNATLQSQLSSNPPVFTELDSIITIVEGYTGGDTPLVGTYGDNIDTFKTNLYTKFFGVRNSTQGNSNRPKGLSGGANNNNSITCIKFLGKLDWISKSSTFRWLYYNQINRAGVGTEDDFISGTEAEGVVDLNNKIEKAFKYDGVFISFGHWHWAIDNSFERHLSALNSAINGRDVFKGTFSQIVVYQFIKNTIDSVDLTGSNITIDYSIKDEERPYSDISNDLLWLELNLTGTSFEGNFIDLGVGTRIVEKDTDLYAIGVSLDYSLNQKVLTITTAVDNSAYDNLTMPVVSIVGSSVTSDQPISYTLFRKTKAQDEWEVVFVEFEPTFKTSHTLPTLDTATFDYYLGFSNEFGITNVEEF